MDTIFLTDVGKLRPHNEDNGGVLLDEHGQLLALVADGMGGHQAGDVASKMTKELVLKKWTKNNLIFTSLEAEKWLKETIEQANSLLFEHANSHPDCEGMGTTLVVAFCNEEFITIAHVGDSRIYLKTEDDFKQITKDHSLVEELVRNGHITSDEALNHPRKNVLLRALGTEPDIKIDIKTINWEKGSCLFLCSDGLTNKITDEEINEKLSENNPLLDTGKGLIEIANDRGGEDNITLAIVFHDDIKDVAHDGEA